MPPSESGTQHRIHISSPTAVPIRDARTCAHREEERGGAVPQQSLGALHGVQDQGLHRLELRGIYPYMYTVKGTHHLSRRAALQAMPATWAGGSSRLSLAAGGWVCFCTTFLPAFLSFSIHVCAPYLHRAHFSTREHNCLKTTRITPCGNLFNLGGGMIRLVWNTLHFSPGGPIHQNFHGTTHPEPPPTATTTRRGLIRR